MGWISIFQESAKRTNRYLFDEFLLRFSKVVLGFFLIDAVRDFDFFCFIANFFFLLLELILSELIGLYSDNSTILSSRSRVPIYLGFR